MAPSKLARAMIKVSVEKALKDIRENPERGLRNLVDLGGQFATGDYQKIFFDIAQQQLTDDTSPYYHIVNNTVQNTDTALLTNFCINIGYNGWTHGANIIRKKEEREGFNIPWLIMFMLREKGSVRAADIKATIGQGKELGIYNYAFIVNENGDIHPLLDIMRSEADCAFQIYCHPRIVKGSLEAVRECANTIVLVDMGAGQGETAAAVELLRGSGLLYGGFARYNELKPVMDDAKLTAAAEKYGMPVLVYVDNKIGSRKSLYGSEKIMMERWINLDKPVFPIDLFSNIALADRNISSEGCLAAVQEDGTFLLTNTEIGQVKHGYTIRDTPLEDIFKKTMPRLKA